MDDKWSALEKYNLWNGNSYKLGLLRTSYINKIHAFVGNKLVKVLVGQRRSGKSYINFIVKNLILKEKFIYSSMKYKM
jgi:predicted AAA+ superfamily ATPase